MATFAVVLLALIALPVLLFWTAGERGLLPKGSTIAFFRLQGLRNILNGKALHGYVYGRWTQQYISYALNRLLPRSDKAAVRAWGDRYHGKVLTPDQAKNIVRLDHPILIRDLEQVIPYPTARKLVLDGPPDIVAYECVCRGARREPCGPTQVCMVIGQPFADFIVQHHPHTSRRLTQAEALSLLEQEHARGHVHSAWFKDVMLDRFYAICNCCSCCCGALEVMVGHQGRNIASSGYVAAVDQKTCKGCGTCRKVCAFKAMDLEGTAVLDWNACMGCGVCQEKCPEGAISLVRDERKGPPLDVRVLLSPSRS
jgi:Pyruvate/2-oxoacid:ferredoxin oxidoreductase delta subunit